MAKKSTEQEQIANAEVVSDTEYDAAQEGISLGEQLVKDQFGGDDHEPVEGTERWDDMVREQVIEADRLETMKREVYAKMEANRTLLRAFRDMGKLPAEVVEVYYKTSARGPRKKKDTENND